MSARRKRQFKKILTLFLCLLFVGILSDSVARPGGGSSFSGGGSSGGSSAVRLEVAESQFVHSFCSAFCTLHKSDFSRFLYFQREKGRDKLVKVN